MASRVENAQGPQRNEDCRFPCNTCGRSFKRLEHLSRHRQGHQEVKRFACPVCFKRFARSDILLRHRLIHLAAPTPDSLESEGANRQNASPRSGRGSRRKRACQSCAKAHESCSKGEPCRRCLSRSVQCVYTTSTSESCKQGKAVVTRSSLVPVSPFPVPETPDESLLNRGIGLLFPEMAPDTETSTANPGDQQPFEDNAAQAMSFLLDMQSMPSHGFVFQDAHILNPYPNSCPNDTIPDPTANSRVDGHPVYNIWNPQGLPVDGPTLTFPINWLPINWLPINWLLINLDTDLNYVSILGQSLSLVSPDLVPAAPIFQQMHPPITPSYNLAPTASPPGLTTHEPFH